MCDSVTKRPARWWRKPVSWGAVVITYAGIIAAVSYAASVGAASQDSVRAESQRADTRLERVVRDGDRQAARARSEICEVIVDVHTNALFRYQTEKQALASSVEYVKTGEDKNLVRRVKQGLPVARARVQDARANVVATRPPPTCKAQVKESQNVPR